MTRWMVCVMVVVATAGCSNDCEELCKTRTDCQAYCDGSDPDCAEESRREGDYNDCLRECEDAEEENGESCEEAVSVYRDCVDRHTCSVPSCYGEERRYFDACLADDVGSSSCPSVCDELASGCYPFELFGYRGPDCEDVCITAATDQDCGHALHDLHRCEVEHSDPGAPCLRTDPSCLSQAESFVAHCSGFAPATVDPEEEAFCAAAAVTICSCDIDLSRDSACEARTTGQCLFELWSQTCHTGWRNYVHCLESLEECTYESIHENCGAEAQARLDACY